MNTMKEQLDALMRLCTAEKESDRRLAKEEVKKMLLESQTQSQDPEICVREMLLELGAPDHLLGHSYMVEALLLCLEDRMYINNITFGLYPQIAAKFDTTASRVERGLRHLIEVTFARGSTEVLGQYFGNTIHSAKGKPTNGEFIARVTNVLLLRIKNAA